MNNQPVVTVGVLIVKEGKVLLVKHGEKAEHINNTYGLPAGRVEEGETLEKAAVRELNEETGLKAAESSMEKMPTEYEAVIERKHEEVLMHFTVFKCLSFEGEINMTGEETVPQWVDITKINDLNLLPNVGKIVGEFLDTAKN